MKKTVVFKSLVISAICVILSQFSFAQKTEIYSNPYKEYNDAVELYNKEKYSVAQSIFERMLKLEEKSIRHNASFYYSMCAAHLNHPNTANLLVDFIHNYPESNRKTDAYFVLAKNKYDNRKYNEAIVAFKSIEITDIKNSDIAEYYFKLGYSYFCEKDNNNAKTAFYEIKESDSKYSATARYYYGHIAYTSANYETALSEFIKLINDDAFGNIVPYYISQIYYIQEKYEELIEYAPPLISNSSTRRIDEIAKPIGQAYLRTNQFSEAIPYLGLYIEKTSNSINREDIYELAYCLYKAKEYDKAIERFKEIANSEDSLSQISYYYLGDCYINTGKDNFAKNMFLAAYKIDKLKDVQQDALFNYALLTYKLDYNPYNEAVNSFSQYIEKYPKSERVDEAYSFLVKIFLNTKNFKGALESIEKINKKNYQLQTAYQRVAYNRGIELFNNAEYTDAISHFEKARIYPHDVNINALTYYWSAEALYRQDENEKSIELFKKFLYQPNIMKINEYGTAHYNIGYAYYQIKDFDNAILWLKKYVTEFNDLEKNSLFDAYLRIADSYFVKKNYSDAISFYQKAITEDAIDADYAIYQKAKCLGILNKFNEKIEALTIITENYRSSSYYDDAVSEMGETYMLLNNQKEAGKYFADIIDNHRNSSFYKNSLLKLGLINYNLKDDRKALNTLKRVVGEYPGTIQSKEALVTIKNIYLELDSVEEFFKYVKVLPFAGVSDAEQDSLTYIAIENRYMNGDCNGAITGFTDYLQKFPYAFFQVESYFYRAECDMKADNFEQALEGYNFVINKSFNKFTEKSLINAGYIYLDKLKKNKEAADIYLKLEKSAEFGNSLLIARQGLLRSNYFDNNFDSTITVGKRLLELDKLNNDIIAETYFMIGTAFLKQNNLDSAYHRFIATAQLTKSELGAEAQYNIAYITHLRENYEESEKLIFEIINQVPSYDYWIAKSFILLADNYLKIGNIFQAKHTLKSIIDNYEGDDLVEIAKAKHNKIIKEEEEQEKLKQEEKLKSQFGESKDGIIFDNNEFEQTTPNEEQQTIPNEEQQTTPNEEQQTTPNEEQQTIPNEEQQTTPNEEQQTTPNEEQQTTPNEEQQTTPNEEQQTTPNEEQQTTPNEEQQTTPNEEQQEPKKENKNIEIKEKKDKSKTINPDEI